MYRAAIDQARSEAATPPHVPDPAEPAFLPVRVAGAQAHTPGRAGVAVVIGSGWRVVVGPGFDAETLRRVVAVLEGRSC